MHTYVYWDLNIDSIFPGLCYSIFLSKHAVLLSVLVLPPFSLFSFLFSRFFFRFYTHVYIARYVRLISVTRAHRVCMHVLDETCGWIAARGKLNILSHTFTVELFYIYSHIFICNSLCLLRSHGRPPSTLNEKRRPVIGLDGK